MSDSWKIRIAGNIASALTCVGLWYTVVHEYYAWKALLQHVDEPIQGCAV